MRISQTNLTQLQANIFSLAEEQVGTADPHQMEQVQQAFYSNFRDFFEGGREGFLAALLQRAMPQIPHAGFVPPPGFQAAGMLGLNISFSVARAPMAAQAQPKVPHVNTEADWPAYSKALDGRMVGSEASRAAIHGNGKNIWTAPGDMDERAAVGWALQQNDNLRYDADRKQFFLTLPDGSTRDVASLDDVKKVVQQNGGAGQNNSRGFQAVGNFLEGAVRKAAQPQTPEAPSFGSFAFMALLRRDMLRALADVS